MIWDGKGQFRITVGGRGWWQFEAGLQYSSTLFFFFYGLPDIVDDVRFDKKFGVNQPIWGDF